MKMRLFSKVFGLGAVVLAAGFAGWACSAPDPGELGNDPPQGPGGNNKFDAGTQNPGNDSGTQNPGNDGGQTSNDPFEGAPPYATTKKDGTPSLRGGHNKYNSQGDPVGQNCFECHIEGGGGVGAPQFAFGGTVYTTKAGGPVGAGVEVRVRTPDGSYAQSAWTDTNGNFRLSITQGGPIPANAKVGVRDSDQGKVPMSASIGAAGGGCAQGAGCHGGSQGKIYLKP